MGLFGFLKKKAPQSLTYRLVWFELQVAPFTYRFAILPENPILIGFEGENSEQGATMLIRYDQAVELFEGTVEKVSAIIQECGILELPPRQPQLAFSEDAMTSPSVHIRIAFSDKRQWAGVFRPDGLPTEVETLLQKTKVLAKQLLREHAKGTINGEAAEEFLNPEHNAARMNAPTVVAKIRVRLSGAIFVDDREVSLAELDSILDELKEKNGTVWYFRESPETEPSETLDAIIKKVLEAIMARELPVQLQTEEY